MYAAAVVPARAYGAVVADGDQQAPEAPPDGTQLLKPM